jgi:hypothetical protein
MTAISQRLTKNLKKLLDPCILWLKRIIGPKPPSSKGQMVQDISFAGEMIQDVKDWKSLGIIASANECSISVFEDCLIDGNLKSLGNGTEEQLQSAWLNIYSDYLKLTDRGSNETNIKSLGKIYALSARIKLVKLMCNGLIDTGYHAYFDALADWGFKLDKIEDVKKVIAAIKMDEMEKSILINNLPKQNKGKLIDRDHFTRLICEFEAMQGFPLDKETLTVAKFAVYYNKLVSKAEKLKNNSHGRRSH